MTTDASKIKAVERLKRKITVENLWMFIVKLTHKYGPLKAYEIKKKLEEEYGVKPATITTYVVIYKMRRDGLLEPVQIGGETLYKPSEKGLKALEEARGILEWIRKIIE